MSLDTVAQIDAAINDEFLPQWANGGNSGFRQAMRDWGTRTHPNFSGMRRYPQVIFRDELHELPVIVLGSAALPTGESLPNRDDRPVDRGMTPKMVFLATNPATGLKYVDPTGLSRGIRFTANEYEIPGDGPWYDRIGWWLEIAYLWAAAPGPADGMRARTAGEGPVGHNQNWHDVAIS